MNEAVKVVSWQAPEHHHVKKGGDWFWILGIMVIVGSMTSFFFGNFLFAIVIFIGGLTLAMVANKDPIILDFAVSTRGLRVGNILYPYSTLESFYIDEDHPAGPQLLAKSKRLFMPLIIMPLPENNIDEIESILDIRLLEEHMEEPLANKLLEIFGF